MTTFEGTLQSEIQQTRPFRSVSQEAVLSLFRTTDILRRSLAQVMETHDLTLQQYNVLRILRGAGERGLPTLAIAERMVERTPGITRLIDRLEKKALVNRERPPGDRRRVVCRITPKGLSLLRELEEPVSDYDDHCLEMLEVDERRSLIRLLDRIREAHAESDAA